MCLRPMGFSDLFSAECAPGIARLFDGLRQSAGIDGSAQTPSTFRYKLNG